MSSFSSIQCALDSQAQWDSHISLWFANILELHNSICFEHVVLPPSSVFFSIFVLIINSQDFQIYFFFLPSGLNVFIPYLRNLMSADYTRIDFSIQGLGFANIQTTGHIPNFRDVRQFSFLLYKNSIICIIYILVHCIFYNLYRQLRYYACNKL